MRTICYVILNYKTYEEAAACAESILSTQTWKNMHIVIVDNGSGNGSEEWLAEHFIDEKPRRERISDLPEGTISASAMRESTMIRI